MNNGQQSSGILDSLRKVATGMIRLYKARLEIGLIELREEIARIERRIILLELLGFLLTMGCICLTGVGVVLLSHGVGWAGAFAIFALLYFAGAGAGFLFLKHEQKSRSEPFSQTLREFEKDAEQLCKILDQSDPRERKEAREREEASASRIAPLL